MRSALILQDNPALARGFEAFLRRDGFACDMAETGEQAIEQARAGSYDIMLIADFVPGAAGFDVIRAIRAAGRSAPIIFVSTNCDMWSAPAREAGADDLLPLPVTGEMVRACVRTWVLQRGVQAS